MVPFQSTLLVAKQWKPKLWTQLLTRPGAEALPRTLKIQVKHHFLVVFHPQASLKSSPGSHGWCSMMSWRARSHPAPPFAGRMSPSSPPSAGPSLSRVCSSIFQPHQGTKVKESAHFPLSERKRRFPEVHFHSLNSQKVVLQNERPEGNLELIWSPSVEIGEASAVLKEARRAESRELCSSELKIFT